MSGLRVVRGPDWKWGNQDDGAGHVGTVEGGSEGTVSVIWDNGNKNKYRTGAEGALDLAVLDNGPAGVKHPGIQCDACDENNLRGIRWKCRVCGDYDLCTECYGNDKHNRDHAFIRIDKPGSSGMVVGKRSASDKIQARGTYVGAIVVRGPDWNKDDQDGGAGNAGVVVKVGYVVENDEHKAACVVKWTNSSDACIYRLGLGGNVDVKYKVPAIGWGYYPDHLPPLRDASKVSDRKLASSGGAVGLQALLGLLSGILTASDDDDDDEKENRRQEVMKKFKVGDLVRLSEDVEEVSKLQDGHGGFNIGMIKALGQVGVVRGIDEDADLKINFGGTEWTLNPDAVSKMALAQVSAASTEASQKPATSQFKVGDRVVLAEPIGTTKDLQQGHGGWHEYMNELIDKKVSGKVKDVDSDGDIKVDFGNDVSFLLNPALCVRASTKDVNSAVKISRPRTSRSFRGSSRQAQMDEPVQHTSVRKTTGGATSTRTSTAAFHQGDQVRIAVDIKELKQHQKGHGGWNKKMEQAIADIGVVASVDKDGDVYVKFTSGSFHMNPAALVSLTATKPKVDMTGVNQMKLDLEEGDEVKIELEGDVVMLLQQGHGGWNTSMNKALQVTGKIRQVLSDGDVKVQYGADVWTLNPAVLTKVTSLGGQASSRDRGTSSGGPECPICKCDSISTVFNCGHGTCSVCTKKITQCAICRVTITLRTKLYI